MQSFLRSEAAAGALLLCMLPVALLWANASGTYETFWMTSFGPLDIRHWVNDALMALFFFAVALEVRRETSSGLLQHPRAAMTPVIAALGGMLVPAIIYFGINAGGDAAKGWGIPMATDIAMTLPFLILAGERVSPALKVFLLTLAVADDIGAVVVIGVFYARSLNVIALGIAVAVFAATFALQRKARPSPALLVLLAITAWIAMYNSGIHATIAGVVFAFLLPLERVERFEPKLQSWTTYLILPTFALANAGVALSSHAVREAISSPVAIGVVLALVAGKPLGICLFTFLATRCGGHLPEGATPSGIVALSVLGGVGFTVSLFVTDLALVEHAAMQQAKAGILVASMCAGLLGIIALRVVTRTNKTDLLEIADIDS
jgi:NhaA family Na+:H+ antiporter